MMKLNMANAAFTGWSGKVAQNPPDNEKDSTTSMPSEKPKTYTARVRMETRKK